MHYIYVCIYIHIYFIQEAVQAATTSVHFVSNNQRSLPNKGVSICQHTSAYVSIRQHTSAYVSVRQRKSAYATLIMRGRYLITRY